MFCKQCGTKIEDETKYCPNCGQPVGVIEKNEKDDKSSSTEKLIKNDFENNTRKNGKGISKIKNIVGIIVSCIAVIVLLMALLGNFDNGASKLGWGKPDRDSDIVTATVDAEKNKAENEENTEEKGELSSFLGCTEEELISGCNFEKNDLGTYPDMDHAIFICLEGQLNSISLQNVNEDSKNFTLFGIGVGDLVESVSMKLKENFTLIDSAPIENGTRDMYTENMTGNYLAVDYNGNGIIFGLGYTLGIEENMSKEEETVQTNLPLTYGTYTFDNGVDAVCTAEVGFNTGDEGGDYINISAMGYGGHELTAFYGNLSINQDGNYEAYSEYLNTTILILFDETGMNIEILSCDDSTIMESIVGKYLLTSELNLNEVG